MMPFQQRCKVTNERIIVNYALQSMFKEAVVTYFNILPQYMSGISKETLRIAGHQANFRTGNHRMQHESTNQSLERLVLTYDLPLILISYRVLWASCANVSHRNMKTSKSLEQ
jgi:hypothetical protein